MSEAKDAHAGAPAAAGASPIAVEVVTPVGPVYKGRAASVTAPAVDGEVGILHLRAPFVAALGTGVMRLGGPEGTKKIFIDGGFLEVLSDKVVVLAESAEAGVSIDAARAREAEKRARERLENGGNTIDRLRARRSLNRAKARLAATVGD